MAKERASIRIQGGPALRTVVFVLSRRGGQRARAIERDVPAAEIPKRLGELLARLRTELDGA